MSQDLDFPGLVELCERTHREMQLHAARTVDHSLVVRNRLYLPPKQEFKDLLENIWQELGGREGGSDGQGAGTNLA